VPVSRVPVVPHAVIPAPHQWDRKRGACRVHSWLDEYMLAQTHCRVAKSGVWCQQPLQRGLTALASMPGGVPRDNRARGVKAPGRLHRTERRVLQPSPTIGIGSVVTGILPD